MAVPHLRLLKEIRGLEIEINLKKKKDFHLWFTDFSSSITTNGKCFHINNRYLHLLWQLNSYFE